jgi:hypothetical protein
VREAHLGELAPREDLEAAAADARKLMASARSGSGPLSMLLNDKQATGDLRAILSNVRRHGVLWYKDSFPSGQAKPSR